MSEKKRKVLVRIMAIILVALMFGGSAYIALAMIFG